MREADQIWHGARNQLHTARWRVRIDEVHIHMHISDIIDNFISKIKVSNNERHSITIPSNSIGPWGVKKQNGSQGSQFALWFFENKIMYERG
jgi:hypothetical protein